MKFDAREAKLLEIGTHFMVDDCPGLRLEASASRRTWVYRYKSPIDDRMRQVKIGSWPAMSEAAATFAWEDLRKFRDSGKDPSLEKRAARVAVAVKKPSFYSVRKLCDDYLCGHVDVHRKKPGATEMRRLINAHLDAIASKPAISVTRSDAFDLLESISHIPVCAQTLRGELGAAWDYALDAGRIPQDTPNWWRLVMRGRLRSKGRIRAGKHIGTVKRVLSNAEVGTLLRWFPNFSPLMSDVLTLYLWTGTRGAEIVAMEKCEIVQEDDGWWWIIPKAKTKNARFDEATDLRVPLIGRALEIAQRRTAVTGSPYIFPRSQGKNNGIKPVEQSTIGKQVSVLMSYSPAQVGCNWKQLPVENWSPHDLRRTTRTMLAALECPDPVAEAILGHMQPGIKGVYNLHSYDKERRQWLKRLDARLEKLAAVS